MLRNYVRWRPYLVEYTGSLLTSEVKLPRAWLVLGWGTAWEHLKVLSAFSSAFPTLSPELAAARVRGPRADQRPIAAPRLRRRPRSLAQHAARALRAGGATAAPAYEDVVGNYPC